MSVNNNIDWKLVAQGYDTNHNGRVDDELKAGDSGLADKNGQISVEALAGALSSDKVVVSNGVIHAQTPGTVPDLPVLHSLNSVHTISGEALGWGDPNYPGWQYQETKYRTETGYHDVAHTHKDGTVTYKSEPYTYQKPYTTYRWGSAIQDIRARLESIQAVTGQSNDSHLRDISSIASSALSQNNWEYFLDEGSAHTRYIALYTALQNINQLSNAPDQPAVNVNAMNGAVNSAQGAIGSLKSNLGNTAVKTPTDVDTKINAAIATEKTKASSIPFWHYLLIFGFFQKHGANERATQLQNELNTFHAANPGALNDQLSTIAKRDYETTQEAWNTKSVDDASKLQGDSQPITNDANTLKGQASDQSNQVQDLIKQLQGNGGQ